MAWQRVRADLVGDAHIAALLWTGGPRLVVPWRDGVAPGQAVDVGGEHYVIAEVVDPGARREILELALMPAAEPPVARERRSSLRQAQDRPFETPPAGAPQDERTGAVPRPPRRRVGVAAAPRRPPGKET